MSSEGIQYQATFISSQTTESADFANNGRNASIISNQVKENKLAQYKGQRWKGYAIYFIFTLFNGAQFIVAKVIYNAYPEIDPF